MATINEMMAGVYTALTANLFPSTAVWYAFEPTAGLRYPPGDTFAVIQPTSLRVRDRSWTGTPATITQNTHQAYLWTMQFTIWLFLRLGTDEAHRDINYLSDLSYGSLVLTDSIVNTLQNYTVVSTPENFGYKLQDISWANKDRGVAGWSYTKLTYETTTTSRSL